MNKKEVIEKIKVLLGMEKPVEESFTSTKLQDGTNVSFDKLAIGSNFLIKTDSESTVPAPAGDYILQDGTTVTVGIDNLITAVTVPEIPVEELPVEEIPAEIPVEEVPVEELPVEEIPAEIPVEEVPVITPEEKIVILEEKIANLEVLINKLIEESTKMNSAFSEQTVKLQELANAPAAEPVHFTKTEFKAETTLEKRLKAIEILKKN